MDPPLRHQTLNAQSNIIYLATLAVLITVFVHDNGVWIPKPESTVEYIMLVTRGIAGFGGVNVLAVII
ncbi:hypothetical protein BGZ89_004006 [Linnemannia elongata]|nr:hypothetical protein BGZ89_004006 [Linnemannia elongata]